MSYRRNLPQIHKHTVDLPIPLPVRISLKGLARQLDWPEISQDLVEVSCAILLADRLVSRPRGTLGPRHIDLKLPVRHPRIWKRAERHLKEALTILGGDTFSFDFYYRADGASCFPADVGYQRAFNFHRHEDERREHAPIDRVALFSGGLDSAAAAALFARQNIRTAYVTHYVNSIHRIEELLRKIYDSYGVGSEVPHAQFHIRPTGSIVRRLKENSRRSRSLLFVSLAIATAFALGVREVCVCENGVMALNIPLTPAMVPTRHAHSLFLKAMEHFARALFEVPLKVVNPFELTTKGEMSRVFLSHQNLALMSISCWNQQWSGRGRNYGKGHCGYCFPCLVRRVSLEVAGISVPANHFDVDVRRLARRSRLTKKESRHLGLYRALMEFVAEVKSCRSWKGFLRRFPDVISAEPTDQLQPADKWFKNLYSMMRRFANEVESTFGER